jgi:hypothetical protein
MEALRVSLVLLFTVAAACNNRSTTARNDDGVRPMKSALAEEDVVRTIRQGSPDQPVGVTFKRHAAYYFLYPDTPRFSEWLTMLQQSQARGTRVRFTYADEGQRLTSLEIVE